MEELSSLQKLDYSYETNGGGGNSAEEFTEPLATVTFLSSASGKGGAKLPEDEVIKVTVKWDDFEESFELHNNK